MESNNFQYLSPASLIRSAKAAHPAFKYAIVVAGLAAIVIVVLHFGYSPATLVFGCVIIVVLMVLFLVFAQATTVAKAHLALPAMVLIWCFLVLAIATAGFFFTSAFFDFPLPLKASIIGLQDLSKISNHRSIINTDIKPINSDLPSRSVLDNFTPTDTLNKNKHIRIALIIGNNNYQYIRPRLKGAINDAKAVKEKLEAKGFQIIYRIDASREDTITAINQFKVLLALGGVGVVYYSGLGGHIGSSDYMIPVDMQNTGTTNIKDFISYSVNFTELLSPIDKIVSDTPESSGDIIVYATSLGGVARDSRELPARPSGIFTNALLTALDQKGLDILEYFPLIATETEKHSKGLQKPSLSSSFNKHFYFDDPSHDKNIGILKILYFDSCRSILFKDQDSHLDIIR